MIEIRLIGTPDEVEPVIEQMKTAVRVEITFTKPSRYDEDKVQYKGYVEPLLQADRPHRIATPRRPRS